jgi:hypothetical protein
MKIRRGGNEDDFCFATSRLKRLSLIGYASFPHQMSRDHERDEEREERVRELMERAQKHLAEKKKAAGAKRKKR